MGNVKVCANNCTLDYSNNNISNNNCNCNSRFGLRSQPLAAITTKITTTTNTQNAAHLSGLAAATTTQVKQKTKTKLKIHKQFRSRLCQLQAPSPSASAALPLPLCSGTHALTVSLAGVLQHCMPAWQQRAHSCCAVLCCRGLPLPAPVSIMRWLKSRPLSHTHTYTHTECGESAHKTTVAWASTAAVEEVEEDKAAQKQ